MNSDLTISLLTFVFTFGGAMLGMGIRGSLPNHHLSTESKDVVKLGMGLVGTMTALVLGLLVASAKNYYDTQSSELTQISANVAFLDRVLTHYGPETKEARATLRNACVQFLDHAWSSDGRLSAPTAAGSPGEVFYDQVQALSPKDESQRALKAQALSAMTGLGQMRWLMFTQSASAVSTPLLIALVFWLTITFISFGLYAPSNGTVVASLFVAAISVSAAVFLIMEMYRPYAGLIKISSAPLRAAIGQLGQ
jgi:hypothetical protein